MNRQMASSSSTMTAKGAAMVGGRGVLPSSIGVSFMPLATCLLATSAERTIAP
jgi:hypothetical protein